MTRAVLAIDQGTTSSKALLVDRTGVVLASGARRIATSHPRPGWVEQDAAELWRSVTGAISEALAGAPGTTVVGIAVSNQRETAVVWDARTGEPVAPAISWQDMRAEPWCRALDADAAAHLLAVTGLDPSSMFAGPKLARLLEGRVGTLAGTVDAWLLDRLTGGRTYATEAGNASRTLLLDLARGAWDDRCAAIVGVDVGLLPQVRPSTGPWGETAGIPGVPDGTPVLAVLADSHAALYGHHVTAPGHDRAGKATYGTGSSIMVPEPDAARRVPGLSSTLAWSDGAPTYALEGNVLACGSALEWLAELTGAASVGALLDAAAVAARPGRVRFVPALTGLGAPWWAADARATLTGLDAGTGRAELALAGVEAVAHQVCDVIDALDPGDTLELLHVGGGVTRSDLVVQTQADLLGRTLLVSRVPDISALGAAALAWERTGEGFAPHPGLEPRRVEPSASVSPDARAAERAAWRAVVQAACAAPDQNTV